MLKFSPGTPKRREVRLVLRVALAVSAVLAVGAPSAFADTVQSSNWAGYAVHRAGVRFKKVVAAWKQPRVDCSQYSPGYSAVWVGLGGFSASSQALEQIGTESDCTSAGRAVSSAWYELVPAPSRGVRMRVSPGDTMFASVTVSGQRVTLVLEDETRHTTFRKTLARLADRPVLGGMDRRGAVGVHQCEYLPHAAARRFRLHDVRARRDADDERPQRLDQRSLLGYDEDQSVPERPPVRRQRWRRERRRRDPVRAEQRRQLVQGHVPDRLDSGEPDRARGRGGGARRLHRARRPPLTSRPTGSDVPLRPRLRISRAGPRCWGHAHRSDATPVLDHEPRRGYCRARPGQPGRLARPADEHEAAARPRGGPARDARDPVALDDRRDRRPRGRRCSATSSCIRRSPTSRSRSPRATRPPG